MAAGAHHFLAKQHGQGIGLFARAAPGDPYAQRHVGRVPGNHVRNGLFGEEVEDLGVAEEAGHIDQQVVGQQGQFLRVAAQRVEIKRHVAGVDAGHGHAALGAALQGAGLVKAEIVGGAAAQQVDDAGESAFRRRRLFVHHRGVRPPTIARRVRQVLAQRRRHVGKRQAEIDHAGLDGAARHAAVARLVRVLGDDQAAGLADRPGAERPVGARARQDDTDGALRSVPGQGLQEEIEGHARPVRRQRYGQAQVALGDGQIGARRNDVEMAAFDPHPVRRLDHL